MCDGKIPKSVRRDEERNREHCANNCSRWVKPTQERTRRKRGDECDWHNEGEKYTNDSSVDRNWIARGLIEGVKKFRNVINLY